MSLFFEKYKEERTGSSVASGKKTTSSTEPYREILVVHTSQMKKQNGRLKKIVKRKTDKCVKLDKDYQAQREEEILKLLARQLRKQRKSLKKQLGSNQLESVANNDNMSAGADEIEHQETIKCDSNISVTQGMAEKDILKAAVKQMKRQEKLLKGFLKRKKHEEELDENVPEKNQNSCQKKSNGGVRTISKVQGEESFLHKLGNIFLKALPSLLCVAAKSLITCVFRQGKRIRFGSA